MIRKCVNKPNGRCEEREHRQFKRGRNSFIVQNRLASYTQKVNRIIKFQSEATCDPKNTGSRVFDGTRLALSSIIASSFRMTWIEKST